jgi:hypothetical protein
LRKIPILEGSGCNPYRSFSKIPESPRCVSGSSKLSEKRMHFVREKRDKPPGRRFHAGKRLSEKREKFPMEAGIGDGGQKYQRYKRYKPPLFLCHLADPLQIGDASAPSARRQTGQWLCLTHYSLAKVPLVIQRPCQPAGRPSRRWAVVFSKLSKTT